MSIEKIVTAGVLAIVGLGAIAIARQNSRVTKSLTAVLKTDGGRLIATLEDLARNGDTESARAAAKKMLDEAYALHERIQAKKARRARFAQGATT